MMRLFKPPLHPHEYPLSLLWACVLVGPLAWALQLGMFYPLVHLACRLDSTWFFHVLTAILILLALAGAVLSWHYLRLPHHMSQETILTDRIADISKREIPSRQFLALSGLGLSIFFSALMVMEWIPTLYLSPCI
jgi:hypothetical protein